MTDVDKQRCKDKAKVRQREYRERQKKEGITRVEHERKEYDRIKKRETV